METPLISDSSLSNRKRNADNEIEKPPVPSKRPRSFDLYLHQNFSLPDSLMYYISMDKKKPKLYEKMIQTCKYFFAKKPILIFPTVYIGYFQDMCHLYYAGNLYDIKNITSKIWITNCLNISGRNSNESSFRSFITSKIYHCDIKELQLWGFKIFCSDLKAMALKCEKVKFSQITVINKNGSAAALENIMQILPKVKDFYCSLDNNSKNLISSKTVSNLLKIPHFSLLDEFKLFEVPEIFDIDTFYDHIKKNIKTKVRLEFCRQISVAYKTHLQTIVNEIIIVKKNFNFRQPCITFDGMDRSSFIKIWSLYYN